jgi:hypothetical protein
VDSDEATAPIPLYDTDLESTRTRPPSWPRRAWRIAIKEFTVNRERYQLVRLERPGRRAIEDGGGVGEREGGSEMERVFVPRISSGV